MNIELEEGIKEVSEELENESTFFSNSSSSLTQEEQHKVIFDNESSSLYSESRQNQIMNIITK